MAVLDPLIELDHSPVELVLCMACNGCSTIARPMGSSFPMFLLQKEEFKVAFHWNLEERCTGEWESALQEQGHVDCPAMAAALNETIRGVAVQTFAKRGQGRPRRPGNNKKMGLLKRKRKAVCKAANSLLVSLRCKEALVISSKVRKVAEASGVSIPLIFNEESIHAALHKLMSIKKAITKSIRAGFYTAQRRDIGRYTSALIKAGYSDSKSFWTKLMGRDHRPHVFHEVKVGDGEYSTDASTVKEVFTKWWGAQFATVPDKMGPKPWTEFMVQVEDNDNAKLVQPVTEADVADMIGEFKDTTPGTDRITARILKELPPFYISCLTQVFNHCLEGGELPEEWKEAAITLLPKEGDLGDPGNYQPIALLQVEYKVFMAILTRRLYKAFDHNILSSLQSGFWPRRSTQDCIRALVDRVEDAAQHKKELHVVYVDMKKAYNSVSHSALLQVLRDYSVNPQFVGLVANLYQGCQVKLKINGTLTDSILYERGVRQGDGLSPLLFVIFLNPMIQWIEKDRSKGYMFASGFLLPLLAYCDDIALLGRDFADISATFGMLAQYYEYYNLDINQAKSGYTNNSGRGDYNLWWNGIAIAKLEAHEHYKYLGVWISLSLSWAKHIMVTEQKVQAMLAVLKQKRIMPDQIVAVLNAAVVAVVAYSMSVVQFPTEWLDKMDVLVAKLVRTRMGLSARYDLEPFFISAGKGGLGLHSLKGLLKAHQRESTTRAINGGTIAADTILASMARTGDSRNTLHMWRLGLKEIGIDPWIRLADPNYIHVGCVHNNLTWPALYKAGVFKWAEVLGANEAERMEWIACKIAPQVPKRDDLIELEQVRSRAVAIPSRGVAGMLKALSPYRITEDDWCFLHKNEATNTLRVWTDGGHVKGCTTAGVYVGEQFKDSVMIVRGGSSFIGELVGVLVALERCPRSCNLEIVIDCTSAIAAFSGFEGWGMGRQMRTEGRGVVKRIIQLVQERRTKGLGVTFTYVPSHIPEKRARAREEGPEALASWEAKLAALAEMHGDDWGTLVKGNEAADALATLARTSHTATYNRCVLTSLDAVALLSIDGSLVEKGLRWQSLEAEADVKFRRQASRVSRGEYLRDSLTDFGKSGVPSSHGNKLVKKWAHSARFKSQTPNAEKMHFYWERDANNADVWYARDNGEDAARPRDWLIKKAVHSTSECPLCTSSTPCGTDTMLVVHKPEEGKKEMHDHVYTTCAATRGIRLRRDEEVLQIISSSVCKPMVSIKDLPLWFSTETNATAKGQSEATRKLREYNVKMGALAFCPTVLPQALRDLGIPSKKVDPVVQDILLCIAAAAKEMWDLRKARIQEIRRNFANDRGIT